MFILPKRETKLLVAVHGWAGVLLGLLLYVVIVTGAAAVFAHEVRVWSGGALGLFDPFGRLITPIVEKLEAQTPEKYREDLSIRRTPAGHLALFFHTDERNAAGERRPIGVRYIVGPGDQVVSRTEGWAQDIAENDPMPALGNFLVELHVRLHLPNPWGLIVTGILGLAMLVAAVSGLLMHRHLLTDLFTLRPRSRVVGLRDAHTVAASWTLPHAFVLAFTGAFLSFALSFGVPLMARVAFSGDFDGMIEALRGKMVKPDPSAAAPADLDRIIAASMQRSPSRIFSMSAEHRGRADAHVIVRHEPRDGAMSADTFVYSGTSGEFIAEKPPLGSVPSLGASTVGVIAPLHFGTFAGWWSKAVWFALGVATAYVTWSGLSLWVNRRLDSAGWRTLGRAVSGVGAGLPLSIAASAAAYFLALRWGSPVFWMHAVFVAAACASLLFAFTARAADVHRHLFVVAGALLLALPGLRLISGGPTWGMALASHEIIVPVLDVLMLIGGLTALAPIWSRARRDQAGIVASPAE